MNPNHRTVIVCGLLLLLGVARVPARAADPEAVAAAVKATYLVNFGSFIEWPATAFPTAVSPLYLCVIGSDPFGGLLDRAAGGQRIAQHPIVVRRLNAVSGNSGCHIVFAADGPQQTTAAALVASAGVPILTVTDLPAAAASKGIINFVIQGTHVRFEIDKAAAIQSGLRISSQLLTLAIDIRPR